MKSSQIVSLVALAVSSAALSTQAFAYGHKNILVQCYEKSTLTAGPQDHVWGLSARVIDILHPEVVNGHATENWISTGDLDGKASYLLANNPALPTLPPVLPGTPSAPVYTSPYFANKLAIQRTETADTLVFENADTTLTIQKQVVSDDAVFNHVGYLKAHLENFQDSRDTMDRQGKVLCQIFNH